MYIHVHRHVCIHMHVHCACRQDTQLVVALGREEGGPKLTQHRRRVLQSVHQTIVVLKVEKAMHTHTQTDRQAGSEQEFSESTVHHLALNSNGYSATCTCTYIYQYTCNVVDVA